MSKYKHIIWDWNGTLLNDAPLSWALLNVMLQARELAPVTFEYYQSIYGHPVRGIYEKAGFDLTKYSFDDLLAEWHQSYFQKLSELRLHDDAVVALESFDSIGCCQAVLSALPHELLIQSVSVQGVERFFADVLGLSDRLGRSKAANAEIQMKRLGAMSEATLMIGDSAHDAEVASLIGASCVLVSRGYESKERLSQYGYPVYSSFSEMLPFVIDR